MLSFGRHGKMPRNIGEDGEKNMRRVVDYYLWYDVLNRGLKANLASQRCFSICLFLGAGVVGFDGFVLARVAGGWKSRPLILHELVQISRWGLFGDSQSTFDGHLLWSDSVFLSGAWDFRIFLDRKSIRSEEITFWFCFVFEDVGSCLPWVKHKMRTIQSSNALWQPIPTLIKKQRGKLLWSTPVVHVPDESGEWSVKS